MKRFFFYVCVLMLVFGVTGETNATIVNLVGDKDGFGIPGAPAVPANGTNWETGLGGVFFTDYRDAFDLANAPFTDMWSNPGGFSYEHTYSLGGLTPISATLDIQIAGIHDVNTTDIYNLMFNGVNIGTIPPNFNGNAFQEILLYSYNVSAGLLTGSDAISLSGTGGDGYSINFSELSIETTAVPEPATIFLLSCGVLGLAGLRRKSRR